MNKSKIEWCDYTWNPVTGCLHGCPYCYARGIARRFAKRYIGIDPDGTRTDKNVYKGRLCRTMSNQLHELLTCLHDSPYPFEFEPTFHRYRLDEPRCVKKPANIFVCSMADLFGEWIPDEWIEAVFAACQCAPQHRYLFLTKNPNRYNRLAYAGKLPNDKNFWYGTTSEGWDNHHFFGSPRHKCFVSVEPLLADCFDLSEAWCIDWVVIGRDTSPGANKNIPKREWVENIVAECNEAGIPVFMKNNLTKFGLFKPDEIIQEYPFDKGEL